MPAFISHCIFADEVLKEMPQQLKEIVLKNYNVFIYGSQGPDFYYYYHTLPWNNKKYCQLMSDMGTSVHDRKSFKEFQLLLASIKDEISLSYIIGYICHYISDTIIHPYVYGVTNNDQTFLKHALIEAKMDAGFLKYYHHNIKEYNYHKILKINKRVLNEIVDLNYKISQLCNQSVNIDLIRQSFKDIKKSMLFIYDATGFKYKVLSKAEKLFKTGPIATKMIPPTVYDEQDDALNLKHCCWNNLSTKKEHNESVLELFDKSKDYMLLILQALDKYFKQETSNEEVIDLLIAMTL